MWSCLLSCIRVWLSCHGFVVIAHMCPLFTPNLHILAGYCDVILIPPPPLPPAAASPVMNTLARTESGGNLSESVASTTLHHSYPADCHDDHCSNHQDRVNANGLTRTVVPETVVAHTLPPLATTDESHGLSSCTTSSASEHVRFGGSVEIPSPIRTEAQRGPTPPGAGPRGPTPSTANPLTPPPVAPKPCQATASVSVSTGRRLCCVPWVMGMLFHLPFP